MSYGSVENLARDEPKWNYRQATLDVAVMIPLAIAVSSIATAILAGTHCGRHHSNLSCRVRDLAVFVASAVVIYFIARGIIKCCRWLEDMDERDLPPSVSPSPPLLTPPPLTPSPGFHDEL